MKRVKIVAIVNGQLTLLESGTKTVCTLKRGIRIGVTSLIWKYPQLIAVNISMGKLNPLSTMKF